MTTWSTGTFHDTSEINNGNQYTTDDNLSIDALNKAIENSFYNVNNSKTQVTKDGLNIGTWDATFADAEKTKSNNASYGAIVHQKEMENYAQIMFNVNVEDISTKTYTTIEEFYQYFVSNKTKTFHCGVGLQDNCNFKTLVGTPTGFANYARANIRVNYKEGNIVEIFAYDYHNNHFATGYIVKRASAADAFFTGWTVLI